MSVVLMPGRGDFTKSEAQDEQGDAERHDLGVAAEFLGGRLDSIGENRRCKSDSEGHYAESHSRGPFLPI